MSRQGMGQAARPGIRQVAARAGVAVGTVSAYLNHPDRVSAERARRIAEATDELHLHALIEIGLVLFIITLIVNAISRAFIWSMGRPLGSPSPVTRCGVLRLQDFWARPAGSGGCCLHHHRRHRAPHITPAAA